MSEERTLYVIRDNASGLYFNGGVFDTRHGGTSRITWGGLERARLFNAPHHAKPKLYLLGTKLGFQVVIVSCALRPST